MKLASLAMRHRATVLRNTATGRDARNAKRPPVWVEQEDPLHCRVWSSQTAGTRTVEGTDVNVVFEDLRMMVALEADVTTADRIGSIVDRRGTSISSTPLRIDSDVLIPGSHRELTLVRITGGV